MYVDLTGKKWSFKLENEKAFQIISSKDLFIPTLLVIREYFMLS
jgi:hypothetical protein